MSSPKPKEFTGGQELHVSGNTLANTELHAFWVHTVYTLQLFNSGQHNYLKIGICFKIIQYAQCTFLYHSNRYNSKK